MCAGQRGRARPLTAGAATVADAAVAFRRRVGHDWPVALPSTLHHFDLRFAQADHGLEGEAALKVARHPSETMERVWLRVLGLKDRMAANWEASGSFAFDYVHAIVLSDRAAPGHAPSVVVPKGKFVPGQMLELMHGERSRNVRFTEFLEQGKDFDWCGIEWEPGAA